MRVEYIARDGRRFETLKECELHEKCRFIAEREEVVAKINRYKHYTLPKAHSTYLQSRNATLENCGLLVNKSRRTRLYYLWSIRHRDFESLSDLIREYRSLRRQLRTLNAQIIEAEKCESRS